MRITVTITIDGQEQRSLDFDRLPVHIGALPDNEIVLDHGWVSGHHASLSMGEGGLLLKDTSRNGCFLGEEKVSGEICLGSVATVRILPFELLICASPGDAIRLTELRPTRELLSTSELSGAGLVPSPARGVSLHTPADKRRMSMDDTVRETFPVPRPAPRRQEQTAVAPLADSPRSTPDDVPANWPPASVLVAKGPPGVEGTRFPLDRPTVRIGRDPGSEIHLDVPTVSWHHATLTRRGPEGWLLSDLGSSNGTILDGERVREAEIAVGTSFAVGRSLVLRLVAPDFSSGVAGTSLPPIRVARRRGGATGAVLILDVGGRADVETFPLLTLALQEAMDAGERYVVIQLGGLEYIDHAGFSVVVQADGRLAQLKGELRLAGLSAKLRETLSLNRLDTKFRNRLFDDEKRAVESIERARLSAR